MEHDADISRENILSKEIVSEEIFSIRKIYELYFKGTEIAASRVDIGGY
jgi:hypothetical protein